MNQNQLYKKVLCSEELPENSGLYDTNLGKAYFDCALNEFKKKEDPEYWFKPIEQMVTECNQVYTAPMQLCPVCNGQGFVSNTGTTALTTVCIVCNGAKIIPQQVFKSEHEESGLRKLPAHVVKDLLSETDEYSKRKEVDYEGMLANISPTTAGARLGGLWNKETVLRLMQEAVKQSRGIVWVTNEEIEAEVERRGIVSCWDKMHGRTMARWAIEKMRELNK